MSGLLKMLNSMKGGFIPEYRAIKTRATGLGYTLPNATLQEKGNDLIVYLKAQGQWTKLSYLYVLYSDTENFTLIDWKTPARAVLTKASTVNFAANGGWLSGASGDLQGDTANNFFGVGVRNVTNGAVFRWNNIFGSPIGFTGPVFSTTFTSSVASVIFNWSSGSDAVAGFNLGAFGPTVRKHYALRRVGNTVTPYVNGVPLADIVRVVSTADASLRICSRGGGNYFNEQVKIVYGGLNTLDVSILETAFNNYLS